MSKRFSINRISTVTNQGLVQFMIYKENVNSDVCIEFLEQLIKSQETKVILILDNLTVDHNKIVKKWVEENDEVIELFYLPSCSPEQNPVQYLYCDLNYGLSDNPVPKIQIKMKENSENYMKMLQNKSERVVKHFKHESIKYAA